MKHINDGTTGRPRLAVFANEWALQELPRRPSSETWSFEVCLEKVAQAKFDGCQASIDKAAIVRAAGLRFCTSGRVNAPAEAERVIGDAADGGADCITLHAGWGMETDAEADAIAAALLQAEARFGIPVYVETHRATLTQDVFRTCRLLSRYPDLGINGDFSHYYCGQEMLYRGFDRTRQDIEPILDRVGFLHGRVSDGQCMQCDLSDTHNDRHVANFASLWTDGMRRWLKRASEGDVFIFSPELGPPSSGYSIVIRDQTGERREVCDRWEQSLTLRDLATRAFEQASLSEA